MKAAVLYGKEDVRIEDVEPKALQAREARVRIEAALTCGTDLKVFKRGYHARMIVPPAVFGHEFAGVITELSPDQAPVEPNRKEPAGTVPAPVEPSLRLGDRVVVANSAPCGQCFYCQNRQENLCDDLLFLNGAYAESIVVPARLVQKNLLRLKPETRFRDAALTEPLACVVQGIEETRVRAGHRVLVIGAGPIGLMFVALTRHLGCTVTVAGRGENRLQTARRLGAENVIDVSGQTELVAAVPRAPGFDVVIEAVGQPKTWEAAAQLVRKGGTVNFFGGCPSGTTVSLDTQLIHYSNLTLLASFHHTPRAIRQALSLIESGVISSRDFVTGECNLDQLPELLRSMAATNRAVKTLVRAVD